MLLSKLFLPINLSYMYLSQLLVFDKHFEFHVQQKDNV